MRLPGQQIQSQAYLPQDGVLGLLVNLRSLVSGGVHGILRLKFPQTLIVKRAETKSRPGAEPAEAARRGRETALIDTEPLQHGTQPVPSDYLVHVRVARHF